LVPTWVDLRLTWADLAVTWVRLEADWGSPGQTFE